MRSGSGAFEFEGLAHFEIGEEVENEDDLAHQKIGFVFSRTENKE